MAPTKKLSVCFVFNMHASKKDAVPVKKAIEKFKPHLLAPEAYGMTKRRRAKRIGSVEAPIFNAILGGGLDSLGKSKEKLMNEFYKTSFGKPVDEYGRELRRLAIRYKVPIFPLEAGSSSSYDKIYLNAVALENEAIKMGFFCQEGYVEKMVEAYRLYTKARQIRELMIVSNLLSYADEAAKFYPHLQRLGEIRLVAVFGSNHYSLYRLSAQIAKNTAGLFVLPAQKPKPQPPASFHGARQALIEAVASGLDATNQQVRELVRKLLAWQVG
ncbi:MAG: hypothetical protein N3E51_01880 [Candidatus Micrarchaeota archaeon]|nr:hypothetical protein [Candidatus Micrarchaeota archaeon]